MKRTILFAMIAMSALFVACGNPGYVKTTETVCDSCQVDSTEVVDTLAIESTEMNSVSTDTISE